MELIVFLLAAVVAAYIGGFWIEHKYSKMEDN